MIQQARPNMAGKHVAVLILCDDESKILLQHRTNIPRLLAFFGGGIEPGETAERAVKRESLEEIGYELRARRLFLAQEFSYRGSEHTKHVFVEQYNGATPHFERRTGHELV
jgi:mutator protein MutT